MPVSNWIESERPRSALNKDEDSISARSWSLVQVVLTIEFIKVFIVLGLNNYEEIDYACYYEQITNLLSGNLKYDELGSRAGGLVYPALHTYLISFNYLFLSEDGMYFRPVQVVSAVAYMICVYLMVRITQAAFYKSPERANIVLLHCLSWTAQGIAIVNMFNDLYCVLFSLLGVYLFVKHHNFLGCLCLAVAMGFKMSAILYLPAAYWICSKSRGIIMGTFYILFIVFFQIVIGMPFLIIDSEGYLNSAYDTSRGFRLKGSYTFNFLPTDMGNNEYFKLFCTCLHVGSLLYFLFCKWTSIKTIFKEIGLWPIKLYPSFEKQCPMHIAEVFFVCNYLGVIWARGVHFQFTIWYIFSLPFLLEIGKPSISSWSAKSIFACYCYIDFLFSLRPNFDYLTATLAFINMIVVFVRLVLK